MKILARMVFLPIFLFAFATTAGNVLAAGALDGKVFVGEAGEKGKPADEKNDVITFADGRFHSSACDQYGFNKAEYKTRTEGDATYFEVETVSEKEGRLKWSGVLKGNTMEGTFTRYITFCKDGNGWFRVA